MFLEYLNKLRMYGKRHFTFQEITQDLNVSENAAKAGLFRLKKSNKIITPIKGLYVMVPPEYQPYGSIPAEELVSKNLLCLLMCIYSLITENDIA